MMLRDLVNAASDKAGGQGRLAAEIGIDGSQVTRFLSGEAGLKIEIIEKILKYTSVVLIQEKEIQELKSTAKSLAKLWAESR